MTALIFWIVKVMGDTHNRKEVMSFDYAMYLVGAATTFFLLPNIIMFGLIAWIQIRMERKA